MPSFVSAATVLASVAFSAVSVSASTFDAAASDNLAVYWGQGNAQKSLGYFCSDDTIDIIPIGFVNVFPDEAGSNGYPGTNFGNACGGFYTTAGGQNTQLLASCPGIEADIKTCQANGKKILLSLGGGSAAGAYIASDASAVAFADFLWGAFGPQTDDWVNAGNPRPFGEAVVDGFDFDIESLAADIPKAIDNGYAAMANEFRHLFGLCTSSQTFYLSAAPQCIVPDGHLANAISNAVFDFLFVQFYNTPQCSARAHFDSTYGQAANGGLSTDISYDTWITWVLGNSANKSTKVYIGLPASPGAAESADYLSLAEAGQLITDFKCKYPANFGGIMLWEATYSDNNQIGGQSYAQNIKPLLTGCSCPGSTTSSSVTSSTTSTSSSTTSTTSTTLSTSTTSTTSATTSSTWSSSYSSTSSSSVSTPVSPTSSSTTSSSTWSSSYSSTSSSSGSTPVSPTSSSTTSSSTWSSSYSSTSSSSVSTPVSPASSSTTSSTTTSSSSSSTPVNGYSTSSSTTTSSSSSSSCVWGSACSSSSTPVGGASTSSSATSSITSSSTSYTPTGWPTFGTCTSSTCKGLATGAGSTSKSADPTTTWASWSADPSSTSSSTLTSTWAFVRPSSSSTSTTTTSVVTMTIVPVPSSVWYASTFSRPTSIPVSSLSLVSAASTVPASSSSSSSSSWSTIKSATGSSVSGWAPASISTTTSASSSTSTPVMPAMTMTTVSVAQGATWSSDPSLTLSVNAVQTTSAAPVATFKGAAGRLQVDARSVWVVMGVMGLVGALVL